MFDEEDDLFLDDVGSLSQIYNERELGSNVSTKCSPNKFTMPFWERKESGVSQNTFAASTKNPNLSKEIIFSQPFMRGSVTAKNSSSNIPTNNFRGRLYDDAEITLPDIINADQQIIDQSTQRQFKLNEIFESIAEKDEENDNLIQEESPSQSSDDHKGQVDVADFGDLPWRKPKWSVAAYNFENKQNEEHDDVFENHIFSVQQQTKLSETASFNPKADESNAEKATCSKNVESKSCESLSIHLPERIGTATSNNAIDVTDELLDDNYPIISPFEMANRFKPHKLKLSLESREERRRNGLTFATKQRDLDAVNAPVVPQTPRHEQADDDVIILDEINGNDVIVMNSETANSSGTHANQLSLTDESINSSAVSQPPNTSIGSLNQTYSFAVPSSQSSPTQPQIPGFELPLGSNGESSIQEKDSTTGAQASAVAETISNDSHIQTISSFVPSSNSQFLPTQRPTPVVPTPPFSNVMFCTPPPVSRPHPYQYGNPYSSAHLYRYPPFGAPMAKTSIPNDFYTNYPPPSAAGYSNFRQPTWMQMNRPMHNAVLGHCSIRLPFRTDTPMSKPAKSAAVKEELRQQNKNLTDQRDQYYQKLDSLNEELNKLKDQKKELMESKKSHQQDSFLKENERLQTELQNKLRAVRNVIDMLSKIIKEDDRAKSPDASKRNDGDRGEEGAAARDRRSRRSRSKSRHRSRSPSTGRSRHRRSRSRSSSASRSHGRHKSRSKVDRSSSGSPKRSKRGRSRERNRRSGAKHRSSRDRNRDRDRDRSRNRDKSRERRGSDRTHRKDDEAAAATPTVTAADATPSPETETAAPTTTTLPPTATAEAVAVLAAKTVATCVVEEAAAEPLVDELVVAAKESPPARDYSDKFRPFADDEVAEPFVEVKEDRCPKEEPPKKRVNYVYYDPEMHWCHVCNVFPTTAKEYLLHLHDTEHRNAVTKRNMIEYPWHDTQSESRRETHPDWSTERVPIRGLPFFVSVAAWYCKLCQEWMGDLHCASAHLKSEMHEVNLKEYLIANPDWEEKWLESRAQAREHIQQLSPSDADTFTCTIPPIPILPPFDANAKLRFAVRKRTSSSSSSCSSSSGLTDTSSDSRSKSTRKSKKKKRRKKELDKAKEPPLVNATVTPTPAKSVERSTKARAESSDKVDRVADDKFVDEWMNAVHPYDGGNEKELIELKNKLKTKESRKAKSESSRKRSKPESRRSDSPTSSSLSANSRSSKSKASRFDDPTPRKILDKPIVISKGRFPFIGKMPSKSTRRSGGGETEAVKKSEDSTKKQPAIADVAVPAVAAATLPSGKKTADNLASTIRKQLAVLESGGCEEDLCSTVVDMDINDDDDVVENGVVNDDASRRKDFEETLKILYPDKSKPPDAAPVPPPPPLLKNTTQATVQSALSPAVAALGQPHASHEYLVSLIESTLVEELRTTGFNVTNETARDHAQVVAQLVNTLQQTLLNGGAAAAVPPPPSIAGISIGNAVNVSNAPRVPVATEIAVPAGYDTIVKPVAGGQFVSGPPVNVVNNLASHEPISQQSEVTQKRKKNPISQKKRRHLRKIREKLEEQELRLQMKIEETQKNLAKRTTQSVTSTVEMRPSAVRPVTSAESDLMLLGIDEADSAALRF